MDVPVYAGDKPIDVVIRSYQMIAEAAGLPPEVAKNFGDYWRAQSGQLEMYHYTAAGKEVVTAEEFTGMQQSGVHTMHLRPEWQPSVVSELRGWLETMGSPADVVVTSNDAVQRGHAASQPAGSQEGFGSFVVGGLAGGFSSNNTWSAIAGQTVVGVVPVAGQLADARDIAAAGRDVYRGEGGSWARLGIAMVAIIPGLDFLKGGSRAGLGLLTEVAEAGLSSTAQAGLKQLSRRVSKEGIQQAGKELVTLSVARTEVMARLDDLLADGNLLQNTQGAVTTARNSLRDHLDQDDLVERYATCTTVLCAGAEMVIPMTTLLRSIEGWHL